MTWSAVLYAAQMAKVSASAAKVGRLLRDPRRIAPAVQYRLKRRRAQKGVPHRMSQAQRRTLITAHVDLAGLGLEIGPSHNPLLAKRDGYNVRVADHLDRDGLVAKYEGLRQTELIEEVDYVLAPGRLTDSVSDRFDYIVGSHLVEHVVCLVSFLQDCEALLKPGGVLTMAVPDKRYCFDELRERSGLGRVVDVYRAAPKVHTEGAVLEHNLSHVRKGGQVAWSKGFAGTYRFSNTVEQATKRAAEAAGGEYVDTHNWVFTPNHFRLLVSDLHELGFVGLREKAFHDTVGPEFYVSLSVDGAGPELSREELSVLAAREAAGAGAVRFA
jgi:SAM-dependent methyltransferase